jgi:hypothetical protein
MSGDQPKPTVASFGPFEADFQTQEIRKWKHGVRLRLPGQSFQILRMLLEGLENWSRVRNYGKRSGLRTLSWTSSTVSMLL